MKVFNLTDVPTSTLEQYGMTNHTIVVARQPVAPGASVDVAAADEVEARAHLEHFLTIGALAIDTPPPTYLAAAKKPWKAPAVEAPVVEAPVAEKVDRDRDRDRNLRRKE